MKLNLIMLVTVLLSVIVANAQNVTLSGKIVDKDGETLTGANVYIKELKKGASSDFDGIYTFSNLKEGEYTIAVSFIGYNGQTRKVLLKSGGNKQDFTLAAADIVLEGLIVTAQKREQSIKEIPTAVTSVDAGFLRQSGITELDKLADYIPGMQVQLQSPNNPGFVIRGITSDDGAANVEPRVSVFQDGVSISKSRGSVVEVYDMQRVEVLKGPQGTLFGRGAQIGAIHFIQNKAQNNNSTSITLGTGNYSALHLEGFVNTPIVKDKLFLRIAGIYKKNDGYIDNIAGGTLNGKDTKAGRISLRYKPEPMTTIDLIYNYQNDTPPGTAFKSGLYAPVGGDTKAWTKADLEQGKDLGLDRTVWGTTLIAKHSFSENFKLTSITAYREFDAVETFDADGTAAPALAFKEDAVGKQFSQEIRTNFKLGDRFEGFGGASYFHENASTDVPLVTDEGSLAVLMSPLLAPSVNAQLAPANALLSQMLGTTVNMQMVPQALLTNGVPNRVNSLSGLISESQYLPYLAQAVPSMVQLLNAPLNSTHRESYKNFGVNSAYEFFVDGTYRLTDWFKLTAGLRYTIEDISSSYETTTDGAGTLGFIRSAYTNDLFMPTQKLTRSKTFTSMVGRIAAGFTLSPEIDAYASVSKGRRPNVIQFEMNPTGDGLTSTYEPTALHDEIVWSYEVGFKGLSKSQRLYYDLAAYIYDYTHFQTSTIDENLQLITKDAGSATAKGIEASLKWQANKMLQIYGNYAFIDAKFDDTDSEGNRQEYAGNTFRLTPENSFALGVNFDFSVSDKTSLFLRPSYNYRSKVYFEEDNGPDVIQDGYGLLNVRFGANFMQKELSLTAFVNNIMDEKYLIDAGNTGRSFGIPTYIAGAPRFFGLDLTYRF